MDGDSLKKRERWLKRIQSVRRYFAYQQWIDWPKGKKPPIIKILKWVWDDIAFLARWNINLLLQLKHFGRDVKRYSGLSYFEQWKRMAYLVFMIRADSSKFRYNHLFEQDRWKKVDFFSYSRHNKVTQQIQGFFPAKDVDLIHHKFKFFECCKKYGWNAPTIHAMYNQGLLTYPEQAEIHLPKRDLFIKNIDGGQGRGSKYILYENGIYRDLKGREYNAENLQFFMKEESTRKEGLLIQDAVKNHKEWKKFTNGSLATCRIVTGRSLKDKDEIIPFFASLRMPVGTLNADNYTLGGIASSIDIETGMLGKAVSCKPYQGSFSWNIHPDTNEQITGSILYKWPDILEFTKEIHRKFRTLAVGWDLSFTDDGVCVIEGNPYWGAEVMESPANKPLYMTSYPIWVEDCIDILLTKSAEEILLDLE